MSRACAPWRSMLFVPAQLDKFIARAHERGADAVVLDLEDSVPAAGKAAARAGVAAAAVRIVEASSGATDVLVRINAEAAWWPQDVRAAVCASVQALVVPKAGSAEAVQAVSRAVARAEATQGLPQGHTRLLLQIEDLHALQRLDELANACERVLGLSLGSEDFSASAGMAPIPQALLLPNQLVQFACARAGLSAFGFPASIADYADLDAFARHVELARQLGFVGALCVHPAQIPVLNAGFSPSQASIEEAHGIVAAYEQALKEGRAAAEYRGRMVDPPVVARAQALLGRLRPGSNLPIPERKS